MSDQISLKSKRKISLSNTDNKKKKTPSPAEPKYKVTIRVPEEDQTALLHISIKLQKLGYRKKIFEQDKWHIAINLFNKLLDYVDKSDIDRSTVILECFERIIDRQFSK